MCPHRDDIARKYFQQGSLLGHVKNSCKPASQFEGKKSRRVRPPQAKPGPHTQRWPRHASPRAASFLRPLHPSRHNNKRKETGQPSLHPNEKPSAEKRNASAYPPCRHPASGAPCSPGARLPREDASPRAGAATLPATWPSARPRQHGGPLLPAHLRGSPVRSAGRRPTFARRGGSATPVQVRSSRVVPAPVPRTGSPPGAQWREPRGRKVMGR